MWVAVVLIVGGIVLAGTVSAYVRLFRTAADPDWYAKQQRAVTRRRAEWAEHEQELLRRDAQDGG